VTLNATYFLSEKCQKEGFCSGHAWIYSLVIAVKGSNVAQTTRERISLMVCMHRATINAVTEFHIKEVGWSYPACKRHLRHAGCISKPKQSCTFRYIP